MKSAVMHINEIRCGDVVQYKDGMPYHVEAVNMDLDMVRLANRYNERVCGCTELSGVHLTDDVLMKTGFLSEAGHMILRAGNVTATVWGDGGCRRLTVKDTAYRLTITDVETLHMLQHAVYDRTGHMIRLKNI